jgi:hypothetical protein
MTPTFGATIRAARRGFHRLADLAFVRVRAGGPPHQVDLLPLHNVPSVKEKGQITFIVWWKTDGDDRGIIETTLRRHVTGPIVRPATLLLDDNGEIVK